MIRNKFMHKTRNTERVTLCRGFTLVELLIVIVVIGILAAMMLFSSTEAVISAKVNNIITTLRDLRTAAMAWRSDNPHQVLKQQAASDGGEEKVWHEIMSYLNNNSKPEAGELKNYFFQPYGFNGDGEFLYVQYKITGPHSNEIKKRLSGRAKLDHLLKFAYGGFQVNGGSGQIPNESQYWNVNREEFFDVSEDINIVLYRVY